MRRIAIALSLGLGIGVAALRAPVPVPIASSAAAISAPAQAHTTATVTTESTFLLRDWRDLSRTSVYTVRPGDTLSSIAQRLYGTPRAWTVLYWANHIRWANIIQPGVTLRVPPLPAVLPAAPAALAPAPPPVPQIPSASAPAQLLASGPWPGGTFGDCVVARESGGNSQAMNATGHYGLYQFSLSTWEEYGGSAALFGRATVAYQEQIFMNALASGGQSNWSAYDGC